MFHIRTKAYHYDRILTLGGAGYKATGRSFVLKHTGFIGLFSMFHYSHLNYGMTLMLNLIVYRFFIVDVDDYVFVTWSTWLFAIVLLYAPFFLIALHSTVTRYWETLRPGANFCGAMIVKFETKRLPRGGRAWVRPRKSRGVLTSWRKTKSTRRLTSGQG